MSASGVDPQKKAFGQVDASSSSRHLASDLIHLRSLHDADWEVVTQNLKEGLSSADPEVQIASLQLLPSLPVQYLAQLVLKDEIEDFVAVCLEDGNPELRQGAVSALGHMLIQIDIIKGICLNTQKTKACAEYWKRICDGLVDPDEQVAGAAFHAIRLLIHENRSQQQKEPTTPWSVLLLQWHQSCFHAVHQNPAAVLHRSNELDAAGLVNAVEVLFEVGLGSLRGEMEKTSVQQTMLWVLPSIMDFLEEQLNSTDAAVVHESASSLLQLCKESPEHLSISWGVSTTHSLEAWSAKALLALENLLESKESVPARGNIILTITKHLGQIELGEICVTARRLLQSISALPRSSDRTRALMHLWRAVLQCDLKMRRLQHSRGDTMSGASLQSLLESPFFSGVVAGHQKQGTEFLLSKAITKASYQAYKQELVSSLMEVVMENAESFDMQAIFPEKTDTSTNESSLESAIQSDLQTDVVDWFAASVVALYLTQACLGWDNVVAEGYYGLTLPADLWLQALQLTSQTLYTILAHYNVRFLADLQSLDEEKTKTRTGKILRTLAGEAFEIQKLMKRMVFFWSFLNAALKPRVLWVVCHHVELPDRVEDIWTYLTDGLKDLLITRPTEAAKKQHEARIEASRNGSLGPQNESVYSTKAADDAKQAVVAFNQSEVALEGMTVALVCLAKLTEALISQYQFSDFAKCYRRVREIALLLKNICNQVLEADFLTVDMFDQCKSALKQLDFLAEHPPDGFQEGIRDAAPQPSGEQDADQSVTLLPLDLSTKECESFPFTNSLSLGFVSNKRSRRHKALRMNLQEGRADVSPVENAEKPQTVPPIPVQPSAVNLAAAVGGLNLKEDESDWQILTGQGDPIQLSIRHQVDAFSRTLEVEIRAENKMDSSDITGVVVSFAIEGPVSAEGEGLLVWYPEKLPAQEAEVHRFELHLTEFGAIEIQPFMDVALQDSDEEMPALSCKSHSIPLVDLLVPVSLHLSAKVYFQEVSSWPESLDTTAVCRWPGTNGAMQLLSALHQSNLKKIWPQSMHSLSIFQTVYLLQTFNDSWISLSITGQLTDLQRMGLAAWAVPPEQSATGNTGYYLCKCTFASLSSRAIASIRGQTSELLSDLSSGGLVLALDPGVGRPPPPPPIHPDCYVSLEDSQQPSYFPDLQSIALTEWKRLNRAV